MSDAVREAADCSRRVPMRRWLRDGGSAALPAGAGQDAVAEECPVALSYNGISHVVMMATPADLEDFATGFSLSEGIVDDVSEIRDVELLVREQGVELAVRVSPAREAALREMRRNLAGRTGCGLCGAESLAQAIRPVRAVAHGFGVTAAAIDAALGSLPGAQPLAAGTGGVHAAAWCTRAGAVAAVREDVGRHNALDKLIGWLARGGHDAGQGFVLVTSRASYEMVSKSARAGIQLLVAVSAPTTLALELAGQAGFTLAAFARPGRLSVYTGAERIDLGAGAA